MKINRYKTPIGPDEERHRTVVETDECDQNTQVSRMVRQELLRYMSEDPFFSQCGGVDFQKARIWHDGRKWVAEFEAVITVKR